MKCRNCGSTEVGMYKEIRGLVSEMNITKEDIQKEIKNTIDSYVRSAMSENIVKCVHNTVQDSVKNEINKGAWGKPSKIQEILADCLKELVMEELKQIDLKVLINGELISEHN